MIVKEPYRIIRNAIEYCRYNLKYLLILLVVIFLLQIIPIVFTFPIKLQLIYFIVGIILLAGYGLCIIQDIINDGTELPAFKLKKVIPLGIRGTIVMGIYLTIQAIATGVISHSLSFSEFELEEMILNFTHTLHELLNHNPLHSTIFLVTGIILTYVTVFFMEIALGMIADGEPFKNSFNLKLIKEKIDIIGWKDYGIEYSMVITSIVLLTAIGNLLADIVILTVITNFLTFVIEFVAMGVIYKKIR